MPVLTDLFTKIATGEKLNELEIEQFKQEVQRLEEARYFLDTIRGAVDSTLVVDELRTRLGDMVFDSHGLFVFNSLESGITFGDSNNQRGLVGFVNDPNNDFEMFNLTDTGTISFFLGTQADVIRVLHLLKDEVVFSTRETAGDRLLLWMTNERFKFYLPNSSGAIMDTFSIQFDALQAGRTLVQIQGEGNQGTRLTLDGADNDAVIDFRTQGSAGGSTFIRMRETSTTPPDPSANDAVHIYIKSDKLIFQFNDGGTVRYKYLDLTGTGVTWVHTTTAP